MKFTISKTQSIMLFFIIISANEHPIDASKIRAK